MTRTAKCCLLAIIILLYSLPALRMVDDQRYRTEDKRESGQELSDDAVVREDFFRGDISWEEAYQTLIGEEAVKKMALIYLDDDAVPELLTLQNGGYHLYTFDGRQAAAIAMPEGVGTARAYGPRHTVEYFPQDRTFYWFEYVPFQGRIRVHDRSGDGKEKYDYYLRYQNGSLAVELKAEAQYGIWKTYSTLQQLNHEGFLSRVSDLGYDRLIPCGFFYDDLQEAWDQIDRASDGREALFHFIKGKTDALHHVDKGANLPESGYVMKSCQEICEDITAGKDAAEEIAIEENAVEEDIAVRKEYVDFDNDGEEELILRSDTGACVFLDVIGSTVYVVMEAGGTVGREEENVYIEQMDYRDPYVAEREGKRVVVREGLTKDGIERCFILQYDPGGCLIDYQRMYGYYGG